ncbi:MAG: type II toxin-antitoxin system YoeB family toxin [Bacteroidales bacterium]|nr:type II toxin-antitoxin system YoeB family toxin [Bacteroidales bacterium]
MIKSWSDAAWEDFEYWMKQDKKTLRRILQLLKDIDRNGYEGIGKLVLLLSAFFVVANAIAQQ